MSPPMRIVIVFVLQLCILVLTGVSVHWIAKRTTPFLQPADQSWMTPLKAAYFSKWNHWLINAPKAYTKAGNMQSPGYAWVVGWISEAWIELVSNLIARSFHQNQRASWYYIRWWNGEWWCLWWRWWRVE